MTSTLLANAKDIEQWAERLDARSQLPRLVRRLIQASALQIERLQFAADEGVQLDGWDGIVTAQVGYAFVPTGVSVWEMGVSKNPKGKADDDYEKRSQDPLDVDSKATTFVFVTPRRWKNKEDWAKTRREEGLWADVRAFDAGDIETWLEQAPAVHLWLSVLIGKSPQGAWSLDDYWSDWAAKTNPQFSPTLVIGGRQAIREQIEKWLQSEPSILALGGESSEEALAFLSSVVAIQEKPERESWFSRTIVIEDAASWRALAISNSRSILVPRFQGEVEGLSRAVKGGNHVFLASEKGEMQGGIVLPRIVRAAAEEALQEMGLPAERARDLATLARRSFPALRRKLASEPTLRKPDWAQSRVAGELLPPLLAGSWQDPNGADREILSRLAGLPYSQLQEKLVYWSKAAEPPLRLVGGLWMMAAPEDAWRLLAPFLTGDDISRFKEVASAVLSAPEGNTSSLIEQLGADLSEKPPSVSGTLREGIASTLALMAALSPEVSFISGSKGEEVARSAVWSLFERAKMDEALWASFAPLLPLLAEAAPTPFLDAVDAGLVGENPFLRHMFHEKDDGFGFGPNSPHIYLLWALETLTWNPDFFGRAVLCLARLTRIDPGGRNGNRAADSLSATFVVWYPNTMVSLPRRLKVLDAVRKKEPDVAWRLLLQVLPTMHENMCLPLHGPKWHDWKPDEERPIFDNEVSQAVEGIVERLLEDAGASAARWCALIARTGDLWPHLRLKMLDVLDALDPALFASEERANLVIGVRSLIVHHREFPEESWAMPEEHLARLEVIRRKLEPHNPVVQHRWLFDQFVPLMEHSELTWEEREQLVSELRVEALREIVAAQGLEGIWHLASQVKDPESVGFTLNALSPSPVDVDVFLAENLASPQLWRAEAALGWVRTNAWRNNMDWLQGRLAAARNIWRPEQWGEFFVPFPFNATLLEQLDKLETEAQRHYWNRTQNAALLNEPLKAERVIESLLGVGRIAATIRVVRRALHTAPTLVSPERMMDVLEVAITGASAAELNATRHESALLFEHLSKTDAPRERLAQLEWLYFALHEHTRTPKVLHEELARDPAFFVEMLSLIYCARPGELETDEREGEPIPALEPEDSQEAQLKALFAQRAWSLLWHWHQLPGMRADGTLDEEHLINWVTGSRELAKKRDRSVITLIHIGHVLAHSPRDEDEGWPHRAVRELIEEIANPRLESGFHCQVFNNRGVTIRGMTDGGAQERVLAEQYEKDGALIADTWPRTASLLRGIAQNYRQHAEREDRSADLTQDLWR